MLDSMSLHLGGFHVMVADMESELEEVKCGVLRDSSMPRFAKMGQGYLSNNGHLSQRMLSVKEVGNQC